METKAFTPPYFRPVWLKLFAIILSSNLLFFGCDQAKDEISPGEMRTTQIKAANAGEDKDEKYKTDKTGQYVSKDVQVSGYDGQTRPTRPKYDALYSSSSQATTSTEPIDDCPTCPTYDEPCIDCGSGGGGTYTPPTVTSTFVSSEGFGAVSSNPNGYIYALRIINGSNSSIQPSAGHIKLNADLNRGAGGDHIYLTFTRNPQYSYENDGFHGPVTYDIPLSHIYVATYSQLGYINPFGSVAPGQNYKHMYRFDGVNSLYPNDLNDGAGGKYIFGHVSRNSTYGIPIKEVGILYGNSSGIQPPNGWVKIQNDLNENAGGDYIYLCYKK